jgi:hypothetical protein
MRRLLCSWTIALLAGVGLPAPAAAQQSISFFVGGFAPRGEDARDRDDVLAANRSFLDFDLGSFGGGAVGAEWIVALGDKLDAGLGIGFYQNTERAADRFSVFEGTGEPVVGDLKLRIIPFTATIRFLPLGHRAAVQPYFGLGAGALRWRYSETGDFVASDGETIVHGAFVGKGAAAGPVVLGGVRFPVGSGSIGGEIRYQSATGDLPGDQGFAGSTIDLGGFNYLLTFNVGF